MPSYSRLGNYLLATELGADLFGKIHRGLTLTGNGFDHHVLIRTFSQEIMDAAFSSKQEDINRAISLLNGQRGFTQGYKTEGGRFPHIISDYVAGRCLTQVFEKAKQEQLPLSLDHALAILQGVAQAVIQMHTKGLRHGVLSPASVWVSFDGATHLLDAPFAGTICALLPRCRLTTAALARYRGPAGTSPLQQDCFGLGAILFELLTFEKLPSLELLNNALNKVTLKAAQEEEPVPADLMHLLKRLLGIQQPFENAAALNTELERVLYEGDYSPTTFNTAFFMHTLFRDENEADLDAMKEDQSADFSPFLDLEPERRSLFETESGKSYAKYVYIGGSILFLLASYFGYRLFQSNNESAKTRTALIKLQEDLAVSEKRMKGILEAEMMAKANIEARNRALRDAKNEREKEQLRRMKEEEDRKLADILKQKEAERRNQQEIAERAERLSQRLKERSDLRPPEPPVVVPPKPPSPPTSPNRGTEKPLVAGQSPQVLVKPPVGTDAKPLPVLRPTDTPPIPLATTTPTSPILSNAIRPVEPTVTNSAPRDTPPSVLRSLQPVLSRPVNKAFLPPSFRSAEIKVKVEVQVDSQGKPINAEIKQGVPGNFPYNDAAKTAAYGSTYAPAISNGVPVSSKLIVEYKFDRPH